MDSKQQKCIDSILYGKNIFITGSGGSGKSFVINHIFELLKESKKIALTAMTGCAAILLNPNARTLHSWAGIGLGKENPDELYLKIQKNKKAWKSWITLDILIIDEVSMLSPTLFEKLNILGKRIRRNQNYFGGIQLVLSGDFFQLPPIEESKFLFESPIFSQTIDIIIELDTVYRQKSDLQWFSILQNIRKGIIQKTDLHTLYHRLLHKIHDEKISDICVLYPINRKVDFLNEQQLILLQEPIKEFKYYVKNPKKIKIQDLPIENFIVQSGILDLIRLAKGAHIMLTRNIDIENGLVNGSQGTIIDFDSNNNPIIQFMNHQEPITIVPFEYVFEDLNNINYEKFSIFQLPLKLAWAVSIHKVQGHTLDCALMDLGSNIFECGQIYVALSRIKSLKGVYLTSFDPQKIKINQTVLDFYHSISCDTT